MRSVMPKYVMLLNYLQAALNVVMFAVLVVIRTAWRMMAAACGFGSSKNAANSEAVVGERASLIVNGSNANVAAPTPSRKTSAKFIVAQGLHPVHRPSRPSCRPLCGTTLGGRVGCCQGWHLVIIC